MTLAAAFAAAMALWNYAPNDEEKTLVVFAAASIAYVLEEARDPIETATDARLVIVEAASSTLARQIGEGAPADVFISVDKTWLDYLKKSGHFDGTPVEVARNRLVWASPKTIAKVADGRINTLVLSVGEIDPRIITGDPEYVPLGKYAKEYLVTIGAWNENNIIPTQNARSALVLLETEAAQRGIIYRTDALSSDKVVFAKEIPEESHSPIIYWAAVVEQSDLEAIKKFMNFLQSEDFKTILEAKGFEVN